MRPLESHENLHEKAKELAQTMTLDEVCEMVRAAGIAVTTAPSGQFGNLTKFADYSPGEKRITLYGDLTAEQKKIALIHEGLHALHHVK